MPYSVRPQQLLSMQTRDGIRLDADVYYPDSAESFPVLLMRQPYGRAIASTVVYAHPSWYAAQGYIVVIQDVRGRGSSEGTFDLFAHEIEDGEDTVNWAASLPQSTGQVGMYGFSYQGMTQLYAAVNRPPALKALCPSMVGYDLYQDWAYEGGAFCYQLNLAWAMQLASETARRSGDSERYRTLYGAAHHLPISDPVNIHCGILNQLAADSHYHDWLAHPEPDAYWQQLSPKSHLQEVDLPMLHIGGWFDTHLRGTWRLYEAMATRSVFPQHLLVGPWGHLPWGRKVGSVDYGPEANSWVDRWQIRWFDHFLKGMDTGLLDQPPIGLFEMGSNRWQSFYLLPDTLRMSYKLVTSGLAAIDLRAGKLEAQKVGKSRTASDAVPSSVSDAVFNPLSEAIHDSSPEPLPDTFVHDPWRPVPAQGGHATFPAGSFERSSIDCRSDVLTYTTPALTADLHLAGEVAVELHCTADSASFDLCAVLSEVKPDGSTYNFTQGYLRIPPGAAPPHTIALQPTCIRLAQGNALRLSISAACFPAFAVNPGTDTPLSERHLIDAKVITVTLHSSPSQPSLVRLPVRMMA